jgi:KDO2-lipid IV(A) lauroyltransferase
LAKRKALPLRKRLERAGGGCLIGVASWLVRMLPSRTSDALGVRFGRLLFRLSAKYRNRTISNLRLCYPEWSEEKVSATAMRVFEHFGKTGARFFSAAKLTDTELLNSVRLEGVEAITEAHKEGKGVLLLTPHLGNWERLAHVLPLAGFPLSVVARDTNAKSATDLVNEARAQHGVDVFSRGSAARIIFRRLANNEAVGILPDQNSREILIPFFGKPAGTARGPAVFHLKTGAPILVGSCTEQPDGTYVARARRLALPEPTGDTKADIISIMTAVNEALEEEVRRCPEQWLWLHDRWRWTRELGLLEETVRPPSTS